MSAFVPRSIERRRISAHDQLSSLGLLALQRVEGRGAAFTAANGEARMIFRFLPFAALGVLLATASISAQSAPRHAATLQPVEAFDGITDKKARSIALFTEVGKVIQHPRCLNCHTRTDTPRQTDFMRVHQPMVVRGKANHGAPGLPCSTCHHEANFEPAGVPGAPHWGLAPKSMAWQGETLGNICRQIKDRKRNGGRDMAALIHHMSEDALVGWAWHPGSDRTPAPGTQKQLGDLFEAWTESGAYCPA
jgi:hypothetical protein